MSEREQAQEHAARLEWIAERTAGVDARRELRYAATFLRALADRPEHPLEEWRDDELAASPTPKAQKGTWTLTAPDGRTWQADSPLQCAGKESNERIPPAVQLARIARELAVARPEQPVALVRTQRYGKPVLPYAEWTEAVMDAPLKDGSPLYAAPVARPEPAQPMAHEPVGMVVDNEAALFGRFKGKLGNDTLLYTAPPSRPAPSEAGAERQEPAA